MKKMTVNMVVDEAVKAWSERVVNTQLYEEVTDPTTSGILMNISGQREKRGFETVTGDNK